MKTVNDILNILSKNLQSGDTILQEHAKTLLGPLLGVCRITENTAIKAGR